MYLYLTLLSFISKLITRDALASICIVDKGIFPLEKDSVAIQLYLDIENSHPSRSCKVESWPNQCCLQNNPKDSECTLMDMYGDHRGLIVGKDRETFVYVLPSIYQHDLFGYCDINLVYQCDGRRKIKVKREAVEILLDTRIRKKANDLLIGYIDDRTPAVCGSIDENCLDDCDNANCDLKYHGVKSYFDPDSHICSDVTTCIDNNFDNELPFTVYVPDTNICQNYENPITLSVIYAINTRMGVVTESQTKKMDDCVQLQTNCSTISQNLFLLRDMLNGKLCKMTGGSDYGSCCKHALLFILTYIGAICGVVLGVIFLFSSLSYLWGRYSDGEFNDLFTKDKKSPQFKNNLDSAKGFADTETRNELIKDVIIRDVPMELRNSIEDICDRVYDDGNTNRKCKKTGARSKLSLNKGKSYQLLSVETSSCDHSEEDDEKRNLVK